MKVHKIELLIIDHDNHGAQAVKEELENTSCANHYPFVMNIKTKSIKWSDDHPLNHRDTIKKTYRELFPEK